MAPTAGDWHAAGKPRARVSNWGFGCRFRPWSRCHWASRNRGDRSLAWSRSRVNLVIAVALIPLESDVLSSTQLDEARETTRGLRAKERVMKEKDIREHINAYLRSRMQNLVVPASMGLGLMLGGCDTTALDSNPDGSGDASALHPSAGGAGGGAGGAGGTAGIPGGMGGLYAAPFGGTRAGGAGGTAGIPGGSGGLYAAFGGTMAGGAGGTAGIRGSGGTVYGTGGFPGTGGFRDAGRSDASGTSDSGWDAPGSDSGETSDASISEAGSADALPDGKEDR